MKEPEHIMKTMVLRPAELERDFEQIAVLFTSQEDEKTSQTELKEYYQKNIERIIHRVAEDENGKLLGFYWAARDKVDPERFNISLIVQPEHYRQGVGSWLYEDMLRTLVEAQAKKLRTTIRDNVSEYRAFAERRGFIERRHMFQMMLDLTAFDDRPYDAIIVKLKSEGFQFTTMEELGNTEEAQRKLFALNDTAAASTPGTDGEHSWASFEDFQQSVCQSDWYKPAGQFVAIDTATGAWAAMSAITRLEGNDYAYNLFTGVDMPYRGRKLAQAVKVHALRYAREVLKVDTVRTHHNVKNLPMIAIDRKLGYVQLPGTFLMEKVLER